MPTSITSNRRLRCAFGAAVVLGAAALPATIAAARRGIPVIPCPKISSTVTGGRIAIVQPGSTPSNPLPPLAVQKRHLSRDNVYLAVTRTRFSYGGNAYTISRGTEFALGCYGQSVHQPHVLYPRVGIVEGEAAVSTTSRTPGALSAPQALINPVGHTAQHISVNIKGPPTHAVMTIRSSGPVIDITPEFGTQAGHCIYHHVVRIDSYFSRKLGDIALNIHVLS